VESHVVRVGVACSASCGPLRFRPELELPGDATCQQRPGRWKPQWSR
jgi:hypothetical protein